MSKDILRIRMGGIGYLVEASKRQDGTLWYELIDPDPREVTQAEFQSVMEAIAKWEFDIVKDRLKPRCVVARDRE